MSAESHHPNTENIWGQKGCQLPDGQLCNACCYVYRIPEIKKPADTDCVFQSSAGCRLHTEPGLPKRCHDFHCSKRPSDEKLLMINRALETRQVTLKEAQDAVKRLIGAK